MYTAMQGQSLSAGRDVEGRQVADLWRVVAMAASLCMAARQCVPGSARDQQAAGQTACSGQQQTLAKPGGSGRRLLT